MAKLKIAVIGVGNMGSSHVRDIAASPNTELAGICDVDRERADRFAAQFSSTAYYSHEDLFEKSGAEAVIIATPHPFHAPQTIAAFTRGIHVLVEKPISVHANAARSMVDAYEKWKQTHPKLVFAAMFMQRTYGHWRKIKELIDGGDLGDLVRTTWIITDWFRTQHYYNTGGWRATWAGEGGGVLLNQCPHNLDLYQWLVGMPKRVTGFASLGKYHDIEVEDEVTAFFEHEQGMVGHFITTTAESPGTNRLEIVGDRAKLVYENGVITLFLNRRSMFDVLKNDPVSFTKVENWKTEIPYRHHGEPGHRIILENFAAAVAGTEELIAPAVEGVNSVSLGNAIMLSSFEKRAVGIPIDGNAYEKKLNELIAGSRFAKPATGNGGTAKVAAVDMGASFQK